MKQAIGTLTLLLMAASTWAQNPATTLQSTQANAQSVQQKKQADAKPAPGTNAKTPVLTAKPVAHNTAAPSQSAKPTTVAVKPVAKTDPKASAIAHSVPAAPAAKPAAAAVKTPAAAPKAAAKPSAQVAANHTTPATAQPVKSAPAKPAQASVKTVSAKPAQIAVKTTPAAPAVKPVAVKATPVAAKAPAPAAPAAPAKEEASAKVDVKDSSKPEGSPKTEAEKSDNSDKKETSKYINVTGKRDPFVSPVVTQSEAGSGCSVGKKCLAIDQISVRGVVKSESGMIAVVVNALDKAYFLRENDPVFNGYVEKITEDSIIFKETYQDKLGKPFTRDVTKRVQAPAV